MQSTILRVLAVFILGALIQSCSDSSGRSNKTSRASDPTTPAKMNATNDPAPTPGPGSAQGQAQDQDPDPTSPPVSSVISDADAQALLTSYGSRCHAGADAKGGVMLSTADEAKGFAEMSKTDMEDGSMPPRRSQQMSDMEKSSLLEWFRQQQ